MYFILNFVIIRLFIKMCLYLFAATTAIQKNILRTYPHFSPTKCHVTQVI